MAAIWSAGAECRTWFLSVGGSGDLSPKPRQAFDRNRYVTRIETRVYPKLEHTGTPCDRFHPGPYTSSVFRATARQARSRSTPSTSAITRIVIGTRYGAFGRPRNGSGARYGASVSTRTRSSGTSRSAARSPSAFRKVTVPANDRYQPRSTQRRAISASPEKQCKTVRSGAPTSSRTASTSACASRSWICLLYTSDAAAALLRVDLGGRRIIKNKT